MTRAPLVLLVLVSSAMLSGCVDDDAADPVSVGGADEESGSDAAAADAGPFEPTPVDVPFSLDGETTASAGACGLPEPAPFCASHVIAEGGPLLVVPHETNATGLSFTMTFEPVHAAAEALYFMVHVDDGTSSPMIAEGELASGDSVAVEDVVVNATARIILYVWIPGQNTLLGPAWVDPMKQPFHVEGTVTELRPA